MITAGAQGAQGILGPTGFCGPIGSGGTIGAQGAQGPQGDIGIQGNQGAIGDNTAGYQGLQGAQGLQGLQGSPGIDGNQGSQGSGIQGTQGLQGAQSPLPPGISGFSGNFGAQGTQGRQGPGSFGVQGNTGWVGLIIGLQGVQGFQGAQGVQGFQGPDSAGSQGAQGSQGKALGEPGPQGINGLQGNQSGTGVQGLQGYIGRTYGFDPSTTVVHYDTFLGDAISSKYVKGSHTTFDIWSSGSSMARLKSGAVAGNAGSFFLSTASGTEWISVNSTKLPTIATRIDYNASSNLNNSRWIFGFANGNKKSAITNGFYWEYDSSGAAAWVMVREVSNTRSTTNTGIAPSASLNKLRIQYTAASGGTVEFYLDGVLQGSFVVSMSTKLSPMASIEPLSDTQKYLLFDYLYIKMTRGQ